MYTIKCSKLLPGGWFEFKQAAAQMYTKSLKIVSCRKKTVQNLSYAVKDEQVWNFLHGRQGKADRNCKNIRNAIPVR